MTTQRELLKRLDELEAQSDVVNARMNAELLAFEDTAESRRERAAIELEAAKIRDEHDRLAANARRAEAEAIAAQAAAIAKEKREKIDRHLGGLQPPPSPAAR